MVCHHGIELQQALAAGEQGTSPAFATARSGCSVRTQQVIRQVEVGAIHSIEPRPGSGDVGEHAAPQELHVSTVKEAASTVLS